MALLRIDSEKSPYILDTIHGEVIPALTRKNADFIEAVVHLDSNYGMDDDIDSKPDKKFDPFTHVSQSKGLYCGSSAYWFNEMKNGGDYKKCLLGAIISIDRTNSTHLEATKDGRMEMFKIISGASKDVNELQNELNKPFDSNPKHHLIGLMSIDLPAKGKNGERSNLSFASKFCSYASAFLGCRNQYSKYDNVVSEHLKDYVYHYLGEKIKKNKVQYSSLIKKQYSTADERLNYVLSIYSTYVGYIDAIIERLRSDYGTNISKDELDHIIWYGFKGR